MFVDRELVLPKALDPYFPWWLNHLMHTMIMVSTLIEMMIAPRKYPRKSFGLLCLLSFMIVYLIWYVDSILNINIIREYYAFGQLSYFAFKL